MNERLKEIAVKAQVEHCISHVRLQEFAELIIQECIGIVRDMSPGYKDYRDQIEDALKQDCIQEIRNQFGVKE